MTMFFVGCLCGVLFTIAVGGAVLGWAACSVSGPIEYDFR